MKKKLDQIAQRKEKEAKRADIYQTLEAQKLTSDQQALLKSSKVFSQGVSESIPPLSSDSRRRMLCLFSPSWGSIRWVDRPSSTGMPLHLASNLCTYLYTASQKETMKARLSRALQLHRAGLPIMDVEAAELLFRNMEVGR